MTLIAIPPFSYGATNNATIMVHDPHWLVDTQVVLLGWVEFSGPGEVRLSVGAGSIAQVDGESDLVRFGWDDDAISGAVPGATSALADATFLDCELDSDSDGTPDCFDECDLDPNKIAPGVCGCGVADNDSDSDGVVDCLDACPLDPNKTSPGVCGCGAPDTDTDSDGTPDCFDLCPFDENKTAPDDCGCGASDEDSDGDGVPNCIDGCPSDPLQVVPGPCGCGQLAVDSDGDRVPDCVDVCPLDPAKSVPGICGCNESDLDSDGDGVPDCIDACPFDAAKVDPGLCGCGMTDSQLDSDGDGVIDCLDGCLLDPLKTSPGWCGCGFPEDPFDTDGDGVPDCGDECPLNPNKTLVGDCGCRRVDIDTDGDGVADCIDACPLDPNKIDPGSCGCGTSDQDSDGNGLPDCREVFLPSPIPSVGGCQPDDLSERLDTDGDGVPDCIDGCPLDPNKKDSGACGCGWPDADLNDNRIADCQDAGLDPSCVQSRRFCPAAPNSAGPAGLLSVSGSFQISRADLKITALGLPPGALTVLYVGRNKMEVPFGQGVLCVAGAMPASSPELASTEGITSFGIDYAAQQLVPGATRLFQVIYLDGSETNTTNAISVVFCP